MNDVCTFYMTFSITLFFSECATRGACPDFNFIRTGGVDENIGERNSFGSLKIRKTKEENITKCNTLINEFRFFLLAEKMNLVSPFFENNCHPIDGTIHSLGTKSLLPRRKVLKMMFNQIEPELTKLQVANKSDAFLCNFEW